MIGATVPWILATRSTGLRGTRDIDVVVNTTSWDDFERAGSRLRDAGFTRRHLHEFVSPHGTRIDLLPYGQGLVRGDTIAWPDGVTMSALGLAEAFDSAVERQITEALSVHVATEAAFALLKVVAYMDRPTARSKDLGDLIDTFARYEEEGDRRFELFDSASTVRHSSSRKREPTCSALMSQHWPHRRPGASSRSSWLG